MERTRVKLCGITRLEDARLASAVGADFLGFVQDRGNPCYIEPEKAKEIIDWVVGPAPVAVFVNESPDVINERCAQVGFRLAQLHGHESPEECAAVEVPVIKTIHVQHDASSEQLRSLLEPYCEVIDFVLLDTHETSLWSQTGESFNWRLARELASEYDLFLSGSINAANFADAIMTMRPYALDLSSSMEESPGVLDFGKLQRFFDAYHRFVGEK